MELKKLARDLLLIAIAVVLAVAISSNIAVFKISGNSMFPTYNNNDIVIFLKSKEIKENNISIVNPPESWELQDKNLIKRTVAKDESVLEVKDDKLYKNNKEILDITKRKCSKEGKFKIKDGEFFVVGDNQASSNDSLERFCWGFDDYALTNENFVFSGKDLFVFKK